MAQAGVGGSAHAGAGAVADAVGVVAKEGAAAGDSFGGVGFGGVVGGVVATVEEWGLPTEPWTFVVDREGRVQAKFEQFTPAEEIEAALKDLL